MVLLAVNFDNLHQIMQSLYTDMMPLCSQMTDVAKALAGLGALFYVAYRVWQSLARACLLYTSSLFWDARIISGCPKHNLLCSLEHEFA